MLATGKFSIELQEESLCVKELQGEDGCLRLEGHRRLLVLGLTPRDVSYATLPPHSVHSAVKKHLHVGRLLHVAHGLSAEPTR